MDILTHTLAGAAAGAGLCLLLRPGRCIWPGALVGALGGFLPDLDVLSRAPGFDTTLGAWLDLPPGTEIYTGTRWYSHHHLTHSLLAALAAGGLALIVLWRRREHRLLAGALSLGWLAHLLLDLPTPPGPWGGVQLLWPHPAMVGGLGWCWWFNNYDLLLLLAGALVALLGLGALRGRPLRARIGATSIIAGVLLLGSLQLHRRQVDYATGVYADLDQASLQEQERLLGAGPARLLRQVDQATPLPL